MVYAFEVYNPRTDRKTRATAVETQVRLFRDNKEIWSGPVKALLSGEQTVRKAIGASGLLRLGSAIDPGEYILQAITVDKLAKPKNGTATQWIDFEVER